MLKTKSNKGNQGNVTLSLMTWSGQVLNSFKNLPLSTWSASFRVTASNSKPIWPVFEMIWDFIHVHLFCKFQEEPIKTEWVMLMTKSNRGFSSNQGNVTLKLMIWSDLIRFRTHSKIYPYPPYLQVSGRSDQNWTSHADDKIKQRLFQLSRGHNSKMNYPIWPVFKFIRDFIHVHIFLLMVNKKTMITQTLQTNLNKLLSSCQKKSLRVQLTLLTQTLDTTTKLVIMTIWMSQNLRLRGDS